MVEVRWGISCWAVEPFVGLQGAMALGHDPSFVLREKVLTCGCEGAPHQTLADVRRGKEGGSWD